MDRGPENTALAYHTADEGAVILPLRRPAPPAPAPAALPDEVVFIRDRSGLQRVCRSCIRSLHAEGNYVEVYTDEKRFVLRTSLRDLMQQLGEQRFQQVNRNTAINLDRLQRVDCDSVDVDGEAITLSRNFRSALIERLNVLGGR